MKENYNVIVITKYLFVLNNIHSLTYSIRMLNYQVGMFLDGVD